MKQKPYHDYCITDSDSDEQEYSDQDEKKKSKKTLKLLKKLNQKYLKIKKNFKKPNKAIIDYINNSSN